LFNLQNLHHSLIVSCQPEADEAFYDIQFITGMASAAILGGAGGLRLNGPDNILAVRSLASLPIIGLWKRAYADSTVYITPTLADARAVAAAGADLIALDATARQRPGGETLAEIVATLKAEGFCLMADISSFEEGLAAEKLGFDCVGTTLAGYTSSEPPPTEPDFVLLQSLAHALTIPVLMEGRIWTPEQALVARELGAYAVVVGSAITRPQLLTRRFLRRMNQPSAEW
jgi:N-acylglucosamine-6-phosphate 2-epimerase